MSKESKAAIFFILLLFLVPISLSRIFWTDTGIKAISQGASGTVWKNNFRKVIGYEGSLPLSTTKVFRDSSNGKLMSQTIIGFPRKGVLNIARLATHEEEHMWRWVFG